VALLAAAALGACARAPQPDPLYQPTQNLLEALAVLRLHVDDDTYRFEPARDFTGRDVYRASLDRLESLEAIHREKIQTGYLLDVILFAKGRAFERTRDYDLAQRNYERVTRMDSPLAESARSAAEICTGLDAAIRSEPDSAATASQALERFAERRRRLVELRTRTTDTHYAHVADEEIERLDLARARYFGARAALDPGLEALALQQFQTLVREHPQSKNRHRNLLATADFYAELARRYTEAVPPASVGFDPATFEEYAHGAIRLYESVAQQDGTAEKLEATRKLEAFLAFRMGMSQGAGAQ
jgi:hypothetical protein